MSNTRPPKLTQASSADVIDFPAQAKTPWSKAGCADWTDMLTMDGVISGPELRVLRALCRHANDATGALYVEFDTIARYAALDRSQCRRIVDALVQKRLIRIAERGTQGSGNSHHYQLLTDWAGVRAFLDMERAERALRRQQKKGTTSPLLKGTKSPKKGDYQSTELDELVSAPPARSSAREDRSDVTNGERAPLGALPWELDPEWTFPPTPRQDYAGGLTHASSC